MKLTLKSLADKPAWEAVGIRLPGYDIDKMRRDTDAAPEWVHFGAGNIFRGFIGSINQRLLNAGLAKTGIIAVETFDFDIIDKIYEPFDNLTLSVTTDAKNNLNTEVLASIACGIKSSDRQRLETIFTSPSLRLASYTITEKGYAVRKLDGALLDIVASDIAEGPENARHAMSITAALLLARFRAGGCPIAMVSMDNCSHNGEKLRASVMEIAGGWVRNGFAGEDFIAYLNEKVSFPWSMIDKITPRPSDEVRAKLEILGVEDMAPVVTSRNTYIAPFVNAEAAEYLVIEDSFPNGRPALEKAGVYMTDRETVNKSETMKVTTCLNPLHTALAVGGVLLGYNAIWAEMADRELSSLAKAIAAEGIKVVVDPKIIDPREFSREVIEDRLPNPNIPDAPQRIATDTSQKVGIRYGETIKAYMRTPTGAAALTAIPLAIALWLRYLLAVDDNGCEFTPSSDPMLAELRELLGGVTLGKSESAQGKLTPILSNTVLFGVNLYEAGLGEKIEHMYAELLAGNGAVRATIKRYID